MTLRPIDASTGQPFDLAAFLAEAIEWDAVREVFTIPSSGPDHPGGTVSFEDMVAHAGRGDAVAAAALRRYGWGREAQ